MITNAITAVIQAPTCTPPGVYLLKLGVPPILPIRSMMIAVNDVITAANAAAMMNATASSTRLPRRMKFLNPVMLSPLGRP